MKSLLLHVRADPRSLDRAAAALLALGFALEASLENGIVHRPATALAGVALAATVAVRRRWPARALIACSAIALAQEPVNGQLFDLSSSVALFPFLLCGYGAGAWLPWRQGLTALATAVGLLLADQIIEAISGAGGVASGLLFSIILPGVPWLVGRFLAERGNRAAAFAALAEQTEAEREEREQAAIAQERVLIGCELQDIIAHSVSVMVVLAGGARRLLGAEPDRARESILHVEQTGRQTLAEMRRLLGLLRRDEDPGALAPQPGLDQLDDLLGALAGTGLDCGLEVVGRPVALTPGIDLVAYRVVEAVLGWAGAGSCPCAAVTISYEPQALELEVRTEGGPPAGVDSLALVRERVELYGGRLTFEVDTVRCALPLEAACLA